MIHARQGTLDKTEAEKENETKKLIALTGEANNLKQLLEHIHPNAPKKSDPNRRVEGTLRAPVAGRLVKHFGEQDSAGVTSEGLTYTAQAGSPVVAPRGGHVVFAGPFRGYGKVLILQHANGDHSFLAGFGQLDATIGQDVESGEPLGTLPTMAGHRPELYFEWRRNNEPLDPTDALVLVKDGKG